MYANIIFLFVSGKLNKSVKNKAYTTFKCFGKISLAAVNVFKTDIVENIINNVFPFRFMP